MKHKKANTINKKQPVRPSFWRHSHLVFLPHAANGYRPHLIRRYSLLVLLVAAIGTQFLYNYSHTGSVLGVKATVTSMALLNDTNHERHRQQLAPLTYNQKLSTAAYYKAQDMLRQQYWAHTAPNGTTPWQWFAKVDYNYAYAGENLAKNFVSAHATTTAWMASPKHRANILSPHYTEVGYAVVEGMLDGKPTTLIVSLFGTPADSPTVAGATSPQTATGISSSDLSVVTRFGIALQSVTPAALGSMMLFLFAAFIAVLAHTYRFKLPREWQRSWRVHHGLIKAFGMASFSIVILLLYSGGQV